MSYRILNKIFKAIYDNGINKAEIECESGLPCSYQCFYRDGTISVLFQTRTYTGETLIHWGEHDNDFAENKPHMSKFLEIKATKDDYTNLIVWYIENKFNNEYEWGEDVVNSLHFNRIE